MWLSKTVPYDHLRIHDINNNYNNNNYKNATALFFKAVIHNCLRIVVVETRFCSSVTSQ